MNLTPDVFNKCLDMCNLKKRELMKAMWVTRIDRETRE